MTENRGKGNSAKGKEEQKPVTTVALDRVSEKLIPKDSTYTFSLHWEPTGKANDHGVH